jgi:hypothetical protein
MARRLSASMKEYGWPPLCLISDSLDEEWDGEHAVVDLGSLPTKYIKSHFWKITQGPCLLIDCDCVATGPFIAPEMENDSICGRFLHPPVNGAGTGSAFLASTALGFGSSFIAAEVGKKWTDLLAKQNPKLSDEFALFYSSINIHKTNLGGTYQTPLPNLFHYGVRSGHLPHNQSSKINPLLEGEQINPPWST